MLWLSTIHFSSALDAITPRTRPWSVVQRFWQFCNIYGEYQTQPPSHRRQFIVELEQRLAAAADGETCQ
jgi:hypothetical protein